MCYIYVSASIDDVGAPMANPSVCLHEYYKVLWNSKIKTELEIEWS
jgi:hypothetical protein